ncbi:MAG TPA: hypothetical protein VNX21_08300, partial [Candidatus Thermoplasmatota archaeon]|nr:hypothetical protein [Candidatus Thermoplasmatota archaeon]
DHSAEAFALFWFGVGVVNALQAFLEVVALVRDPGLPLAFAVWNTRIVLALTSFAGLVYYLLYVYTGRPTSRSALIVFYALAFLLMQVWLMGARPTGTDVQGWRVDLTFEDPEKTPLYGLVVVMFFVPPLVAAAAYLVFMRLATGAAQRRRVRLLSASLVVYFAGLTLGYLNSGWAWWGLMENVLGLAAAAGAIAAFRPPREADAHDHARESAFAERVHQLV